MIKRSLLVLFACGSLVCLQPTQAHDLDTSSMVAGAAFATVAIYYAYNIYHEFQRPNRMDLSGRIDRMRTIQQKYMVLLPTDEQLVAKHYFEHGLFALLDQAKQDRAYLQQEQKNLAADIEVLQTYSDLDAKQMAEFGQTTLMHNKNYIEIISEYIICLESCQSLLNFLACREREEAQPYARVLQEYEHTGAITAATVRSCYPESLYPFRSAYKDIQRRISGEGRYSYNGYLSELKPEVGEFTRMSKTLGQLYVAELTTFMHTLAGAEEYRQDLFAEKEDGRAQEVLRIARDQAEATRYAAYYH